MRTKQEAIQQFTYHAPNEETLPKYVQVNHIFQSAAVGLWDITPDGPGKTLALRKLADARMAFNSAIANNGD